MKVKSKRKEALSFFIKNLRCLKFLTFIIGALAVSALPISASQPTIPVGVEVWNTHLEAFVGFYQLPSKVSYIEIFKKNENLLARQLWDKREYVLIKKSDLEFESKDEEYKGVFIKNEAGKITGLKILNRIILTKVNYNPEKPETLTPDRLQPLLGRYQFQRDKNLFLEIGLKGNSIVLKQLWDGKVIEFGPRSATDFYNAPLSFPLTFVKEGDSINRVICFDIDVWERVK